MCMEVSPADMDPTKVKLCPLVNNPRWDCYCLDMTSRNIERVVRYCSGDYEQCTIYIKIHNKRKP